MKKLYAFFTVATLCIFLVACSTTRSRFTFTPTINDRTGAVIEVTETQRSKTDILDPSPAVTEPKYFEIIAARTTAASTSRTTKVSESPEETSIPDVTAAPAVTSTTSQSPDVIVPITPVTKATTAATTKAPPEHYIVKFVDTDGYTTISVQSIEAGESAVEPAMPNRRGGTVFLGWDKEFSNVQSSLIVKALYQKEWLTVRFFDIDGTLLKSEEVLYGDSASAPKVSDRGEYRFDGWNSDFTKVYKDIDVYAKYYIPPVRSYTTLPNAYKLLPVSENTLKLPATAYYRRQYNGVCTLGNTDYAGNIIYGNFSDTLDISGFGFTSFEGIIALDDHDSNSDKKYSVNLYIYLGGKQVYQAQMTRPGSFRKFNVDLTGASSLTIRLEPFIDGQLYYQYYGTPEFIGGLINAVIYEN